MVFEILAKLFLISIIFFEKFLKQKTASDNWVWIITYLESPFESTDECN